MDLPGYDAWKLATPPCYELTAEEERVLEENRRLSEKQLREDIAAALTYYRRSELEPETIRRIVLEELDSAAP